MNKIDILHYLLNNTKKYVREYPRKNTSQYEISLLEAVLELQEPENYDIKTFPKVLEVIEKDGYDMTNFLLYNSTEEGSYTFMSTDSRHMFDITHFWGGDIRIVYMDENFNQKECNTIAEAISKYQLPWD